MKLDLSADMTFAQRDGITRVDMQQGGQDVAVLLVPRDKSTDITGQLRSLAQDGYRLERFAPMEGEPHITAYVSTRPLRAARRAA